MSADTGLEASVNTPPAGAPASPARWEKLFFAAVGLSALWIGFWGYFLPGIQKSIPFAIPPLHARFLGAMYLSAAVMLLLGYLGPSWTDITVVPVMTAVWTGGIFLVSMLHTDLFDFGTIQTWIWFIAYGVYPVIAIWLVWVHRRQILASHPRGGLPAPVRFYLLAQGALLVLLAVPLLLAPSAMAEVWPWAITVELAQLYFAPFLSFGIGSLLLGRMDGWRRLRTGAVTMAVFAFGVLTASLIHRELFSPEELADQLWFGLFGAGTLALILISFRTLRNG
jgi:hypothetical protein